MSEFEGQEKLEELRKKHPGSITEADREFLNSRRSYLQPHEKVAFGIAEDAAPESDLPSARPSKGLTKVQIQEKLDAQGIEFDSEATKPHLAALLDGLSDEDEDEKDEE